MEELNEFNERVWEIADGAEVSRAPGYKLGRSRWVICNKGDTSEYDIRAQLVACEINTFKSEEIFVAPPPLEAINMLFNEFATARTAPDGTPLQMSCVDIRKA